MIDLKPCPICHGEESDYLVVYAKYKWRKWRGFVKCLYCGEFVNTISVYWTEEEAKNSARNVWNRRAANDR